MKNWTKRPWPAAFAAAGLVVAASAASEAAPADDLASLERIKTLAGSWLKVDEEGHVTDEVVSSYRVIAAGSAVVETVFEGTEHEMLTVYHRDGDELVLTHYCMEGNQPRYRARADGERSLVFECQGGTNMTEKDAHMHEGRVTWVGEDRIRTRWGLVENGKETYVAAFELVRQR